MAADLPAGAQSASIVFRSAEEQAQRFQQIKLGTCAWNFDDWQDVFYPTGLASNQQLPYYAHYLPAVEIDSTFYHTPRLDVVAAWADRTPDDFVFTAKMPKQITHEARLRHCERELTAFLGSLRPLGQKLGAILIQFSPSFRPDHDAEALEDFVKLLPTDRLPFAMEFRQPDWHQPRFVNLLADHNISWVWNDLSPVEKQADAPFEFLPQTGSFLYVRLMGDLDTKFRADGERQFRYGSLLWSRESALAAWAKRIEKHLTDTSRIYVMINNHFEGFSPLSCQRLANYLGLDLKLPSLSKRTAMPGTVPTTLDEQMSLF